MGVLAQQVREVAGAGGHRRRQRLSLRETMRAVSPNRPHLRLFAVIRWVTKVAWVAALTLAAHGQHEAGVDISHMAVQRHASA